MHSLNPILSMVSGSQYSWFTSCTCGWWHQSDRDTAIEFEQDKVNQQIFWILHVKEIKLRFDGRHL